MSADKVTYDYIWLNKSVPVLAGTFFQLRQDPVPAGTLKIGSGAPLLSQYITGRQIQAWQLAM
jgi:hypothetical protein